MTDDRRKELQLRYDLVCSDWPCPYKDVDKGSLISMRWEGRPAWWSHGEVWALKPSEVGKSNPMIQAIDAHADRFRTRRVIW